MILFLVFLYEIICELRIYCELYSFGRTRNETLTSHLDDICFQALSGGHEKKSRLKLLLHQFI